MVSDVVVLIDREQGGRARLTSQGLQLHAAFTLRRAPACCCCDFTPGPSAGFQQSRVASCM